VQVPAWLPRARASPDPTRRFLRPIARAGHLPLVSIALIAHSAPDSGLATAVDFDARTPESRLPSRRHDGASPAWRASSVPAQSDRRATWSWPATPAGSRGAAVHRIDWPKECARGHPPPQRRQQKPKHPDCRQTCGASHRSSGHPNHPRMNPLSCPRGLRTIRQLCDSRWRLPGSLQHSGHPSGLPGGPAAARPPGMIARQPPDPTAPRKPGPAIVAFAITPESA
jgi:hypothetical protein